MIDRRKNYILMIDTETANSLEDAFVYDLGVAVVDKWGNVFETASFVCEDIFIHEQDLMQSAYYADKLPDYWIAIWNDERKVANFFAMWKEINALIKKYDCSAVCAHNARFDVNALNKTMRYLTKSRIRYFFPYGTEIWDTMQMAQSVILKMPTYKKFCEENGYMTNHKTPRPRVTAEVLYKFISKDTDFVEAHQGLADVLIEKEILKYCYRQHKAMRKLAFTPKP